MNFLQKKLSKTEILRLAKKYSQDSDSFGQIMEVFFNPLDSRHALNAAWLMSHCFDENPELLKPHLKNLISYLKNQKHNSIVRITYRVLQNMEIPSSQQGKLIGFCFETLEKKSEPVANKAFAMTILHNISLKNPELKKELRIILEDQLPFERPAFLSRASKILKQL